MKNKKNIIKIITITLVLMLLASTEVYCAYDPSTTRLKIDDSEAWTNINVSDSYGECEALNSTTSTLGTSALEAHLTTDYDWSIMAIFSVSQYGKATTNSPKTTSTTKNKSGIYDIGTNSVQTTTLLKQSNSTSTEFIKGLYEEDGTTLKKYVNKIDSSTGKEYTINNTETGRTAIAYLADGGTYGWLGGSTTKGADTRYPLGIKNGLFGVLVGVNSGNPYGSGGTFASVTFRPVIWN